MARTLSTSFKTEANAQSTGAVFLTLLTIDYAGNTGNGSASCAVNSVTKTITRVAGNWLADNITIGNTIAFTGFVNGANNATFVVTAVTATVVTFADSTTLVTEGSIAITYIYTHILKFVNNQRSITSNGTVYLPLAFNFTMPQDGEGQRSARIEMDNVDRRLSLFLLGAGVVNITVNEQLIQADDPNTIEITRDYYLRNVSINRKSVSGELMYLAYLFDEFPKLKKTPDLFPGVF